MILLGLGSNLPSSLGDRFHNINLAISKLTENKINIIKKSSFYESLAYPNKDDPKFINIVIKVESSLSKESFASVLISIEESIERKRNKKNAPRTCDIDILDFNNLITTFKYKDFIFNVPHKGIVFRNFVLYPLKEIMPNWIHPITKEPIDVLINNLSNEDKKSILKITKPWYIKCNVETKRFDWESKKL